MAVANEVQDHQARCVAPLISLRMLAQGEAGEPIPRRVVVEVARGTATVLAEAEAAGHAALIAVGVSRDHPREGTFLRVRLDRLAAAADDAVTAARAGDFSDMRERLRRFDTLASAIWTVEAAVYGSRRKESMMHHHEVREVMRADPVTVTSATSLKYVADLGP